MPNYPSSLQLRIRLKTDNLYELCQLCLPIINEVDLPSIKTWEIPMDSNPRSKGLEKRLIKLKKQIETAGENDEPPYLSYFVLKEGTKHRGDNIPLLLCYYDDRESYCAGHCDLHLFIERHHTIEDIQKFIDCAVNFARKLIERASVSSVSLYRGSTDAITPNILVDDERQMMFVNQKQIEERFDRPEVFWNAVNINHIQVPLVRREFTGEITNKESSFPLGDEPANPTKKSFKQLSLFDFVGVER